MGFFFLAFDTVKKGLANYRYGRSVAGAQRPPDFDHLLLAGSTAGFCFWLGEKTVSKFVCLLGEKW